MDSHKPQYYHVKEQPRRIVGKHLSEIHQALIGIAQHFEPTFIRIWELKREKYSKCIFCLYVTRFLEKTYDSRVHDLLRFGNDLCPLSI
jgi:hypothetical protein